MKYFDNGNKVSQDACALDHKQRENNSYNHYMTFNAYEMQGSCEDQDAKLQNFAMEHPNLTFRVGFGVTSPCKVDEDSKIRMGAEVTNYGGRQNLCTRNFVAGPNFSRGESQPVIESILLNGVDTIEKKDCHKLAECQFNVFQPLTDCVQSYVNGAAQVIDDDVRIGQSSKQLLMSARSKCVTRA